MLEDIDFKKKFKTVGIVGTGLMGGSFGKAIKANIPEIKVIGFDKSSHELASALATACIDKACQDLESLAREADLIVLATPLRTYEAILKSLPKDIWDTTWLTDLGSVKEHPYGLVKSILPDKAVYVGGHPMAGSEKCGCENSSEYLFNNATFYLTADKKDWIRPVKNLVEALGSVVKCLDVESHDRIVSVSSHVPHITAALLVSILHDDIGIEETGGGYQDTTRIAGSDPVMWTDILLTNKKALLSAMDQLHSELHKITGMIEKEDDLGIYEFLSKTRSKRLGEGGKVNGDYNRRKAI